jgi:hypothetical protein
MFNSVVTPPLVTAALSQASAGRVVVCSHASSATRHLRQAVVGAVVPVGVRQVVAGQRRGQCPDRLAKRPVEEVGLPHTRLWASVAL